METALRTAATQFELGIATVSDLPEILNFVSSNYGAPYNEAPFWKWRYFQNPVASVMVYVARTQTGKIAAMQAVSRYSFRSGRQVREAHMLTGALTAPQYRRMGLFRSLVQKICHDLSMRETPLLFTFPNKVSVKGFRMISGWNENETLSLYVRPLFSFRGGGKKLHDQKDKRLLKEKLRGLDIVRQPDFPKGGDELLKSLDAGLYYIDRSKEYLTWRYCSGTANEYEIFHALHGGEHEGYVVLTSREFKGFAAGLVVDLAARSNAVAQELLRSVVIESTLHGFRVISFLVGRTNPFAEALKMNNFVKWPSALSTRRFYHYAYSSNEFGNETKPAPTDLEWYLTWGDTDVT